VFFGVHGPWGKIGNFLILQAFSTQVHQSAPSLHDDCFTGSGAGCSSTAFPILIAANAIWETLRSTERQIKKIELIFEYIFGSLRPQASQ